MKNIFKKLAICFASLALVGGLAFLGNLKPLPASADGKIDESKLRTIIFDYEHNHFPNEKPIYKGFIFDDVGQKIPFKCTSSCLIATTPEYISFANETDWGYSLNLTLNNIYSIYAERFNDSYVTISYTLNDKSGVLFFNDPNQNFVEDENASISNPCFVVFGNGGFDKCIKSITIRYYGDKSNNVGAFISDGSIIIISVVSGVAVVTCGAFLFVFLRKRRNKQKR